MRRNRAGRWRFRLEDGANVTRMTSPSVHTAVHTLTDRARLPTVQLYTAQPYYAGSIHISLSLVGYRSSDKLLREDRSRPAPISIFCNHRN